ncbi:hypothetical protein BCY90_26130 [Agrobacterium deltaense]|nr:hypothetical protein BCY90_26130 [Agrobacterium deltaense]
MTCDGLAVTTAGAVEAVDRQALLAVGAAIAIFAADGVGAATFRTFEQMTEQVSRAVRCIQPVALPEIEQLTDLFLTLLHPLP